MTKKIEFEGELIEVEISAHVEFGVGGPDPDVLEDTTIIRNSDGADITDLVPEKDREELEEELFQHAWEHQPGSDD